MLASILMKMEKKFTSLIDKIYITPDRAVEMGFTNHGRYFFLPIWITDESCPLVTPKCPFLEPVMIAIHYIEGFVGTVLYPLDEPYFQFLIGARIKPDKEITKI